MFDVTATVDYANCEARADIEVEWKGNTQTIAEKVPVSHLLFLEKQVIFLLMVKPLLFKELIEKSRKNAKSILKLQNGITK